MNAAGLQRVFDAMPEPPPGAASSVELMGRDGRIYVLWSDMYGSGLRGTGTHITYLYGDGRRAIARKMRAMATLLADAR